MTVLVILSYHPWMFSACT